MMGAFQALFHRHDWVWAPGVDHEEIWILLAHTPMGQYMCTGCGETLLQDTWDTWQTLHRSDLLHRLGKARRAYSSSILAHWVFSIRRNLTHIHRWEWDDGEPTQWGPISKSCWTCCHCLATVNPRKRKPRPWSPFHLWN